MRRMCLWPNAHNHVVYGLLYGHSANGIVCVSAKCGEDWVCALWLADPSRDNILGTVFANKKRREYYTFIGAWARVFRVKLDIHKHIDIRCGAQHVIIVCIRCGGVVYNDFRC